MTVPNVGDAIKATLHTLRATTGKKWGDSEAPEPNTAVLEYPYGILDVIPGGQAYGDVGQPSSMLDVVVQLRTVAPTAEGARWLSSRAFQVMLAAGPHAGSSAAITPAPPTVVISRRHDSSGGVDPDGPLFQATERYVLTLSVV